MPSSVVLLGPIRESAEPRSPGRRRSDSRFGQASRSLATLAVLTLVCASGTAVIGASAAAASTSGTTALDLKTAGTFSVLAAAAATIPGSILPGEVGAQAAVTDDAGTVYGSTLHLPNDSATQAAVADALAAYNDGMARVPTGDLSGDDLAGQVISPGIYHRVAAYAMTTPVTFDAHGDPNAVFIMQGDAALNTTASTSMILANNAQAANIFWVLNGAATLGASSTFDGTILTNAAVTVGASSTVNGKALSVGAAVTLDASIFTQ